MKFLFAIFIIGLTTSNMLVGQDVISGNHMVRWGESVHVYIPYDQAAFAPKVTSLQAGKQFKSFEIAHPNRGESYTEHGYEYYNSAVYYSRGKVVSTSNGPRYQSELLKYTLESHKWQPFAKLEAVRPLYLFPLSEDHVIGISISSGAIVDGARSYPFGVYKIAAGGELRLTQGYDLGLEHPMFQNKSCNYPELQKSLLLLNRASTDDFFVLYCRGGIFWIFSREKARLSKTKIISNLTDEDIRKGRFQPIITGVQPRRDGDILISTRDLSMAKDSYKVMGRLPNQLSNPRRTEDVKEYHDVLFKLFPHIFWYEMDLKTNKINETNPPDGAPSVVENQVSYANFNWRIEPDGSVKVYSASEHLGGKIRSTK